MSDYLTPRQVEVYERLIKKLLFAPNTVWNSRNDWSESEREQLKNIELESSINFVSCSKFASHVRDLISKSNELMFKRSLITTDVMTEPNANKTSPGLEKMCAMDKSIATVYHLVNTLAATDSLYSMLLKIYDHPDVACRGYENLWMMDIHIGNAMRNYASQERANIVAFLKGFPQQSEPGNDF